jgi:hypothetical protein
MQLLRFVLLAGSMTAITACGGSTEKLAPDASVGLPGLGQLCNSPDTCPANASSCVKYSDTGPGICTPVCLDGGTMTTNSAGAVASVTPDPGDAPQSTICSSSYPASGGRPSCETFVQYTPMDLPVLASKTYTNVRLVCAIVCLAGDTCPAPLHCDAEREWCVP